MVKGNIFKNFFRLVLFLIVLCSGWGFVTPERIAGTTTHFPWKEAGLTEKQAVAHLLSRFTWGATPGQVEQVQAMGVENWFLGQLDGRMDDRKVVSLLKDNDAFRLSTDEMVATYLRGPQIAKMAVADGSVSKDSISKGNQKEYRRQIREYMRKKGIKPERELLRQMINQKIIRAVYAENQLNDVLTDFWFNHFNVSFTKPNVGQFIPGFERDVIRPRVTARFEDLLLATAQSPAMLMYLDNFSSVGAITAGAKTVRQRAGRSVAVQAPVKKKVKGLNENYAREIMELHTMGVEGGYTQRDVTEAARILTGWTILPSGNANYGNGYQKLKEKAGFAQLRSSGFVERDNFLFTPNRHDAGEKNFLGENFPAGHGYEEGVTLIQILARHPSTAFFIARKIAVRFVSDEPPAALVDAMTKTYLAKNGDIREVILTMVSSSEFWSVSSLRQKTKSPFELTVSALRSLKAEISDPYPLFVWINRMGQSLYSYQAPTGFPDRGQYWINTGSLLNRMNFGLALADARIKSVSFDLLSLNSDHEPESAESALIIYSQIFMPERTTDSTIKRLTPLLNDPELAKKVSSAAGEHSQATEADSIGDDRLLTDKPVAQADKYRLSQVVGILIGSPEFQRR